MGVTFAGFVALALSVIVVQIVALYLGTLFAGLIAGPGRALLAFVATVAFSIPGVLILLTLDLSINTHDALNSLVNLGAGTLAVKLVYNTDFGLALLGYGLSAVLSLLAMSAALLVIF